MDDEAGLVEALNDGDDVVLSTGATATVRGSYPKGYRGNVRILLAGAQEFERADGILLIRPQPMPAAAVSQDEALSAPDAGGLSRAPDRRMQD